MRTINFDRAGYKKYKTISSSIALVERLDNTYKNVLAVMAGPGSAPTSGPAYIALKIDLGAEYTIDEISFDRYFTFNESFTAPFYITVTFQNGKQTITTTIYNYSENSDSSNNGQWVTETPSFDPVSNVRYITINMNLEWQDWAPLDSPEIPFYDLENLVAFYLDNIQISDQGLSGYPASNHSGLEFCPICFVNELGDLVTGFIHLLTGEKHETATDLSVQSPAAPLAFTRSYRQSKLTDANYAFMGLGWQHNHNINLTENTLASPKKIVVRFSNGSEAYFTEESTNVYVGDKGSISTITKDGMTGEYTLVTSDKSIYFFDSDGKLVSHQWPNNDVWSYSYSSDLLTEVSDGYGRSLQFSYIDNSGQYDDKQLWRVGDHTAADLDTGSPTGRYVEFAYAPEKSDGSPITTPGAVLVSVQDVRGEVWTYDYYGQHSGETDSDQLNFMTEVGSPSVDRTGNGTLDGAIQLKSLVYDVTSTTVLSITQQLGIQNSEPALLESELDFQPDSQNITTETVAGLVTTHRFAQDMYVGKEDPAGHSTVRATDSNYRPTLQQDADGNAVTLEWTSDAKYLSRVSDALNHETQFAYNTSGDSIDTLNYSVDAEGRKTQYTYDDSNNPRLPTGIQVFDTDWTTVLRWQEFTYDSYGRNLTETVLDPADGVTVVQQTTRTYGSSGNGAGLLESVTVEDPLDSGNNTSTTYTYDSWGRVIKTQQSSLFGTCQFSYTVYDEADHVLATVCGRQNTTAPTSVEDAVDMYDANDPVMKDNKVTTHEYDSLGRRVSTTTNAGSDFAQTTLTVYDALNRVIRTIGNYVADVALTDPYIADRGDFDHGSDHSTNLITDTVYNARGIIRKQVDALGNATLYGYDAAGRLVKTVQNASDPNYNNDYTGISPDPTLENYEEDTPADTDIITLQAYDAAGNLVKTVDPLGIASLTVYDELNRPVKTIRSAKAEATVDLNPGDMGYDAANDPRSDAYEISPDPDRDLIALTEYDAMGRVIRTRRLLENRPLVLWETTLFGFDALGRQVRVIRNASRPDYDLASDPGLESYSINRDTDKDILTLTVYETNGRVLYTEDALGSRTWLAYDGLGRQIKTIANAQGTDTDDGTGDPRSDSYVVNSDADKDLITTTVYDSDGRIQSTTDVLGRVSYNVYDAAGRLFRTITNYVEQSTTDPFDWFWSASNNRWEYADDDDTPIEHGTDNDQNIITETIYDAQGRASQTLDTRRNMTFTVYGGLGRRIKTIANYIEQGSSDPADWIWNTGTDRWEDGANNAIDFGSQNDQNRITTTTYDLGGRVSHTRDAAGIETRFEYDALGRRISTLVNYVDGSFDPEQPDEDLISTTVYNKAGQVVSTADTRETQTAFSYDKVGRRLTVTRAATTTLASVDYTCYDKAGRVLRTIQNWTNDELADAPDARGDFGNWLFAPETHGADNDRDLVTAYLPDGLGRTVQIVDPVGHETLMRYDKAGQMVWQSDPTYSVTRFLYDQVHRRQRVIQGYLPIPINEKIAYFSYPSDHYEIFTMEPDGDYQTNLTNTAGQDTFPHWSPDGSRIVFVSDRVGISPTFFYDVYVMDADGDNLEQLTNLSGYATQPAWSPDGGQIVFSFKPDGSPTNRFDLYLMNADGTNLRVLLTDSTFSASRPRWSPEGQRIVFYGSDDEYVTSDIYTIHVDGSGLVNLTSDLGGVHLYPSWLWDGSKIAFQSSHEGEPEVFVMNADGSHPVNLTQYSAASDHAPDWSADGNHIVFYSKRDTANREIYVMDADGANVTRLTTNTDYNQFPSWSQTVNDPATWTWNSGSEEWVDGESNPLPHGVDNDRNIIVDIIYDKASRVLEQREPIGNSTLYAYDDLNRRLSLTNPLTYAWETDYSDLETGGTRVEMSYPGINGDSGYTVQRDFDRLGRLVSIVYGDASTTPDVTMTYDAAGNRIKMSEFDEESFAHLSRETSFSYDALHRLAAVAFDVDGDSTPEETVSYVYDAGGLRTQLTLPDDLTISYSYDARGRLVSMTDWDDQMTQLAYDTANRHIRTDRANHLRSEYAYDLAGHLEKLRHTRAAPAGFPSTPVLDDFNRADGSVGSNWSAQPAGYSILDDQMLVGSGNLLIWDPTNFGADQEVFVTLATINEDANEIDLMLKTDWDSYALEVLYNPVSAIIQVWTFSQSESWVQQGSNVSIGLADGDQFGARATAEGRVEIYQNGVLIHTQDVSSWSHYADGGHIGLWMDVADDTVLDDFGGGNTVFDSFDRALAHFEYQVDARGNRVQALEVLAQPETSSDTVIAHDDPGVVLTGTWSEVSGFAESTDTDAVLKFLFLADHIILTMGKGSDHSIYDIYLDGALWQSVDGYAASATQADIEITISTLLNEGPHIIEVRNQNNKNASSSGYKLRFQQALVTDKAWTVQSIEYAHDVLARLQETRYNPGINMGVVDADLLRQYRYTFDRAGNRTQQSAAVNGGSPTITNYTYNAANQLTSGGAEYDANGNMIFDGVNSYTWDRANRLLSMGGVNYQYDAEGRRVQQTVSSVVTKYLLDVQPSLAVVLSETSGANTMRYVHSPRGIHAHKDTGGNWEWMVQDGLGSVREVVDNSVGVLWSTNYDGFGNPFGATGTAQSNYGFTGELMDGSGLLDLRARRYNAGIGTFANLDPLETANRYAYVSGNPVNITDPSGLCPCTGVQNDADCGFLQRAIDSVQSDIGVIAIRDAAFGSPTDVNNTCSAEDTSLDGLVAELSKYYPIASITNFSGNALVPARHRIILLRLAEAVIIMNRKLALSGTNLSNKLTHKLSISFDYEVNDDTGQGYVNLYNTSSYPMQLGNNTVTDAVVHEWGHAFDREAGLAHSGYLNTVKTGGNFHAINSPFKPANDQAGGCDQRVLYTVPRDEGRETYNYPYYILSGVSEEGALDYQRCHQGYGYEANNQPVPAEDWADMFMNWIYDNYPYSHRNAGFDKAEVAWAGNVRRIWMEDYVRNNL